MRLNPAVHSQNLIPFPNRSSIIVQKGFTLKKPRDTVNTSPIIGSQASNESHTPYLPIRLLCFSIVSGLI